MATGRLLPLLLLQVLSINSEQEATFLYGCAQSGEGQASLYWDGDQVLRADFAAGHEEWTGAMLPELKDKLWPEFYLTAQISKERVYHHYLTKAMEGDRLVPRTRAPATSLFPADEPVAGQDNVMVCHVSRFYPPTLNVTWTQDGVRVTEGAVVSDPYPEVDGSFSLVSSLPVRLRRNSQLACTVGHQTLRRSYSATWRLDVAWADRSAAVLFGVCAAVGTICLVMGGVLLRKARQRN